MLPDIQGSLQGTSPIQNHDALLSITRNQFTKSYIQDKSFFIVLLGLKMPKGLQQMVVPQMSGTPIILILEGKIMIETKSRQSQDKSSQSRHIGEMPRS